jgi:putative ABC transport system permease protein
MGNPKTALAVPFSLVLTESLAQRIFGQDDPMGKIITYDNRFQFTVTGIIRDVKNLHIKINALAPFSSLPKIKGRPGYMRELNWNHLTYLLVREHSDVRSLEKSISALLEELNPRSDSTYLLRPFKDIYFARNLQSENGVRHGNRQLIFLFSTVAVFILLIACINFINLSTAQASVRTKEICVRKVVGAGQSNLIKQFFFETAFITFISLILSMILVKFLNPTFNRLVNGTIAVDFLNPKILLGIGAVFVFTALAAGLFPSFYMSAFSPMTVFKGKSRKDAKSAPIRKALIVVQFALSIILVIGTLSVIRQIRFMQSRDLGFNIDRIVNVQLKGNLWRLKKHAFRRKVLQIPGVEDIVFSSQVPGRLGNTNTWLVRGEPRSMKILNTEPEYLDFMGLELIQGRKLSRKRPGDRSVKYIINEKAAAFLGFGNPLGAEVRANFGRSEIIGVVKDFHFKSLHEEIAPLGICWYERWADVANIRISGTDLRSTLSSIRGIWQELFPAFPFSYEFLDKTFAELYRQEKKLAASLEYFASLAVFLACLGLFGLSSFLIEQKRKEIGIRKVMGSSTSGIMWLLSLNFTKWIVLANLFAWPAAYYAVNRWLSSFPYRTGMGAMIFVSAGFFTLIIAWLTVGLQTVKAARANPVESLRYE